MQLIFADLYYLLCVNNYGFFSTLLSAINSATGEVISFCFIKSTDLVVFLLFHFGLFTDVRSYQAVSKQRHPASFCCGVHGRLLWLFSNHECPGRRCRFCVRVRRKTDAGSFEGVCKDLRESSTRILTFCSENDVTTPSFSYKTILEHQEKEIK